MIYTQYGQEWESEDGLTAELAKCHINHYTNTMKYLVQKGYDGTSGYDDKEKFGKTVGYNLDKIYLLAKAIEKELPCTPKNIEIHREAVKLFNYWKEFYTRNEGALS